MEVRKSLALSLLQKYSSLVINIVSTIILARLLTPAEIGVFSIGAAFVAIAHSVRDFGITNYVVQEKNISLAMAKASLFVALLIAWSIGVTLFFAAPFIAEFYDDSSVTHVFQVMAISFFFLPFSAVSQAFLKRNLNFKALYIINTTNTIIQAVISIVLAYYGFGFMSLAWAVLASSVVNFLMSYVFKDELVSYIPSYKNLGRIISFGGMSTLYGILSELGTNAPEIIMGKTLGFSSVGLYSRGVGLATILDKLVVGAVANITTPVFSAKARAGEDLKYPYLTSISYLTVVAWPFLIFIIINAEPIVLLMFGKQWGAAVPIVQILCCSHIIRALGQFGPMLLIAVGNMKYIMKSSLLIEPLKVILIFFAASSSLYAVAIVIVISSVISLITTYVFLFRIITFSFSDFFRIIYSGIVVSILSNVFGYFGKEWLSSFDCSHYISLPISNTDCNNLVLLLASGISFFIFWMISIFIIKHPITKEVSIAVNFTKRFF